MAAASVESQSAYGTNQLPNLQAKSIYQGRYNDRTPAVSAAGKLTCSGDSALRCMRTPQRPATPEIIQRFRNTIRPDAGKTRIFYGKANDPHLKWAAGMTHGISVQPSVKAGELVNPQPNSLYRQRLVDRKEDLYASHYKAPLGKSHDQSIGLPRGIDRENFTFGIRTEKDGCAGELVNPNKSYSQVMDEGEMGRELYRKTHFDFKEGEQSNRGYVNPNYDKDSKFGIPTPHENDGRHVRSTLKWLHDTRCERMTPVVAKRVDDFRERTQPQLGQVHDPIKDTLHVASDHTFGILFKPDEYSVGDLMHGRAPGEYLRGKDRIRGVVSAMRQHLKKANYHNFPDLMAAFRHYDLDGSGKIDIYKLRSACLQFNLPAEPELLEQLLDYCDVDRDGLINYSEFANFLNWQDKMPHESRLTQSAPAGSRGHDSLHLQKQIDQAIGNHQTSSNMINAVVGGIGTQGFRNYGVPTIRTDLPAPRIKRVSDRTNYGDESDAYGLTNPSIYSSKGVYEKDFLMPRNKEEIRGIFSNIGTQMDYDSFDKVYNLASSRHPKGHVCVESFRNVLDEFQATQLHRTPIVY